MELLAQNASKRKSHMRYTLLTPLQLLFLLDKCNEVMNGLKLQVRALPCYHPVHLSQ